jgi:hypothetical protein
MKIRLTFFIFVLAIFAAGFLLTAVPAQAVQAEKAASFLAPHTVGNAVVPAGSFQSGGDCAGLTVDDLRAGGLKTLRCRLHCDPIGLSDGDLSICIDQYSGASSNPVDNSQDPVVPAPPDVQPETPPEVYPPDSQPENPVIPDPFGDQPIQPVDPNPENPDREFVPPDVEPLPPADMPRSLGPLATSPLVPLAGGLIGTAIGWLVSVATTAGSALWPAVYPPKPLPSSPNTPNFAPPTPAPPAAAPPAAASEPSTVSAGEPPATPSENLWNIATNLAGSGATVTSTLSEFFDFDNTPEVVRHVQDAMRAWHANPTLQAAEAYRKSLEKTLNLRVKSLSDTLGNISLAMDGVDAVRAGLKTAAERGYTGSDKFLAVGAEYSKKVLNFALTKNPMVSLVNSALGAGTQMAFGDDGRLDIGAAIEKGSQTWDATTREYAGYTDGSLLPGDFATELANDAVIQSQDQYLHGIRRIKSLIQRGLLTRDEGCARIRDLRNLMGGNS